MASGGRVLSKSKPRDRQLVFRQVCRRLAGADSYVPVVVVQGYQVPTLLGESAYYTNKRGELIHHPGAYGYPMIYHASSRRVEVGIKYVAAMAAAVTDLLESLETPARIAPDDHRMILLDDNSPP